MDAVTQERILLEQDDQLLAWILGDLSQFQKPFEKVLNTYNDLNLGNMTVSVFNEIKAGKAILTVKWYQQALEDELDRTKVFNPTLRKGLLRGSEEPSNAFLKAVSELINNEVEISGYSRKNKAPESKLTLADVSFDGKTLFISDNDKEVIAEKYCRHYLEYEDDKELYNAVKIITEQFKVLMKLNKKLEMQMNTSTMACINPYVIDIGEAIQPNIQAIAGNYAWSVRRKRYQ